MDIVCILQRDPLMVPCAECYEDHCGVPGCHTVHACWPCYREYVDTYLPHGGLEECERHIKQRQRVRRMHAAYGRKRGR